MEAYVFPVIGRRQIETITSADLLEILSPIWAAKNDTAQRIKQRVSSVFDWAKGAGHYPFENPLNGISKALPRVSKRPEHMASLHWTELPAFVRSLRSRDGISASCLEFIILTAARSGEARGARWSEIKNNVWTIPASRMKGRTEHRVPLSKQALAVLEKIRGLDSELLFPSHHRNIDGSARQMSDTVFAALYKRMNIEDVTTHGFRSTFRDWCSEKARAPREIAELALAHTVGGKVERAYARSDLFEQRAELMARWGNFSEETTGKVVRII
ncbi:site-specific integrase [Paracoccus sp. WLY502]|nr:site-specific integrase [Paracoccus sp. WLY502]